ncbi:hypothetical protein ELI_0613 [Eubacterium callanderi]|uniref:Uncharacterized protein n=1 Tax=Eubacterium callanderi TaxID=53442 RepID=E3GIZ4_9FIRM|nr:hypothetical protein ELI_0613 [Eubacterium callanderi]
MVQRFSMELFHGPVLSQRSYNTGSLPRAPLPACNALLLY